MELYPITRKQQKCSGKQLMRTRVQLANMSMCLQQPHSKAFQWLDSMVSGRLLSHRHSANTSLDSLPIDTER